MSLRRRDCESLGVEGGEGVGKARGLVGEAGEIERRNERSGRRGGIVADLNMLIRSGLWAGVSISSKQIRRQDMKVNCCLGLLSK